MCCVMKCVIASVNILKLDRLTLFWIVNLALYFISVVTFSDADQCFTLIFLLLLFIQAYYDSETALLGKSCCNNFHCPVF